MKRELVKAKSRMKLWNELKLTHRGLNSLRKNHSLKCNCAMCRYETYYKRLQNKQSRMNSKSLVRNEINDI